MYAIELNDKYVIFHVISLNSTNFYLASISKLHVRIVLTWVEPRIID